MIGSYTRLVTAEACNANNGRRSRNPTGYRADCPFCRSMVLLRGAPGRLTLEQSCGHYASVSGLQVSFVNYG